jgi:hypothetical protein
LSAEHPEIFMFDTGSLDRDSDGALDRVPGQAEAAREA